jgi:hypothetical protein
VALLAFVSNFFFVCRSVYCFVPSRSFAAFEMFPQAEQLTYEHFVVNTDVSQYDSSTLLNSARECFKLSKTHADKLLHRDFDVHPGEELAIDACTFDPRLTCACVIVLR